jgi:hypothetical protein
MNAMTDRILEKQTYNIKQDKTMMTLELDEETTSLLKRLVEQEHIGAEQVVKKALTEHANAISTKTALITDYAGVLAKSPSFQGDPLEIQKTMRDEWN